MGTIKFTEEQIITKKDGVTKVWSRSSLANDTGNFIVWQGVVYHLIKNTGLY
jgi:hypothetical protein